MKKALIHIDYTNDFVADDGALTCGKPGQDIHHYILDITKQFVENGDMVAFTIDLHQQNDPYHPETKLFPPHNIQGTKGRLLYGELESYYQSIKSYNHVFYFDKTRYSAFAGTDLALRLRERSIEELHLVGVCTDICVLHTAIDAYNQHFKLVIHEKGVASFNASGHQWALSHFKDSLGATIV
ncbi:cysteine hydrolase [Aerococcaceae bacterium zg-ZUI334]|uniref:cysteine hydrolase family protein n=1 Tax=Aerococcaceae bacterium zg-252 TaxID=2796928 RepID=UPI001B93CC92|nr:cysteine hydrolase [Aerococcaceae bacterium zg-ZUI334]MBS4461584.1 cysteine hydrolase [Aerococcaceae bacterium zg-B36]